MKTWLLVAALAQYAMSHEENKNQPGLGNGLPNPMAPPGEIPPGCWKTLNGPAFKLAALTVNEPGGGQRAVSGEIISQENVAPEVQEVQPVVEEVQTEDSRTDSEMDEPDDGALPPLAFERRSPRLAKVFRRQEQDITVTSRITRTSTATVTLSPGPVQSHGGSWTKTVYGATVNQAPNGQAQIIETPVPIVLQPKTSPTPTPFAPLPKAVPRITQAANGQLQASRDHNTPQKVDSRVDFVVREPDFDQNVQGNTLEVTLSRGQLKDKFGRIGYISSARQVQ